MLPFVNLSDDREQEYFADGMVEEIITALSRMRWLFVIARNSSFTYKGRAVDVKQVGRELGVRYVLEGSVRKDGNRVRIAGQLIDTSTGAHLWADRFDGDLANIFDLQDQVTASVAGAIAPKLEEAEIERAKRKPTESLDAYDYFLRGMAAFHQWTREANNEALPLFYKAIELDPNFAAAYGMAARCYARRKTVGWVIDRAFEIAETSRLARRAAELGRDDAVALCSAGIALAFVVGDLDSGDAYIDRALVLNPNLAVAWFVSGLVKVWLGEPEVAIEREARAMRLSPHDPQIFNMQAASQPRTSSPGAMPRRCHGRKGRSGSNRTPSTRRRWRRPAPRSWEPCGSGGSHGPFAPTDARPAPFQSQGLVPDPARGRFRPLDGGAEKSRAARVTSSKKRIARGMWASEMGQSRRFTKPARSPFSLRSPVTLFA